MVYRDNHLLELPDIFVAEEQRMENVDFVLCPNNLFCGMNGMYFGLYFMLACISVTWKKMRVR